MKYVVATYHRREQKSIDTLLSMNVKPKDILVATQDVEDYGYIIEKYPEVNAICDTSVHNIAGNRNQAIRRLKMLGEDYALVLDDDILEINTHGKTLQEMIDECIRVMRKYNLVNINFAHFEVDNPYYQGLLLDWHFNGQANLMKIDECLLYREDYDLCEDTVMGFDMSDKGLHYGWTGEYNIVAQGYGLEEETEGGCSDLYKEGLYKRDFMKMVEEHPKYFLKIPSKTGAIFFYWPTDIVEWQ